MEMLLKVGDMLLISLLHASALTAEVACARQREVDGKHTCSQVSANPDDAKGAPANHTAQLVLPDALLGAGAGGHVDQHAQVELRLARSGNAAHPAAALVLNGPFKAALGVGGRRQTW
jgi:hypothetical protein